MPASSETTIANTPHIKNGLIRAVRELLEHRALWLYLLVDQARKEGLEPDRYASQAVNRCGHFQGAELVEKGGTKSLKGLRKTLFSKPAQWVFEMKVRESTDDKLSIDFHYCPLVASWQKQGCTPEEIAELCDIAMSGDRGIAESFGCTLALPTAIAHGDAYCQIRFSRPTTA
ncbi:MAG: L-2-amino-thiazoline-4-carboxylic acid hydrolase [Propionibacteriaceae bacterium]|jgi:hypothetical protein|nr:L-2-amino-thiazoline-4-carboxylic acid hydrolase [Propionibacteriaceae bacterium]